MSDGSLLSALAALVARDRTTTAGEERGDGDLT